MKPPGGASAPGETVPTEAPRRRSKPLSAKSLSFAVDNQEGGLINVLFPVMASSPNMSPGATGVFTRVRLIPRSHEGGTKRQPFPKAR